MFTAPCLGLILLIVSAFGPACSVPAPPDTLAAGFSAPPDSARPWVYWMWMDGNLTRDGITADLEAMKKAGLGGVIICEVNVGVPRGPVEFMSPEWRKLFAHVVREAERLGLEITLNAGPGWTGSGGPWVKPEQSMQHIVAVAVDVSGPSRFDAALPRPKRRPAYFGDRGLPAALQKAMDEFYRDVAVVAFPTPAAGASIADIDEKALYIREPYSSKPGIRPFLPSPADYPALPAGSAVDSARIVDLTSRLAADGRLTWDVPPGRWTILRFGRTATGANTRPAPIPGLGLECDKFDKAALDAQYDAFVGALLREIGPRRTDGRAGWTMLHIDSWEMGSQNWTAAFRDEFRRRRGYDPLLYLPAIAGRVVDSAEISERFLWDLRQTAQELILENHALYLKELGKRDGFGLSIEPYDMTPLADLTLGTAADVPMSEFWLYGFNTAHSVIEVSGLAHTNGKRIMAAESFTSGDDEAWRAYPGSVKALGDWALSAGVNRIVFHRYQNQAGLALKPGMTMGPYGVHWERTQTWWGMVPAFHEYLSRCQFMLRQGLPVADICYLVAEGAPHAFRAPESALRGAPPDRRSYNFDACASETLLAAASVKDGRIVFSDGMSYRLLVLPERETMTPALLRKVRDLAAAGATIIGPRPRKSPSLSGYPACDMEVAALAAELWGDCDGERVTEHAYGKGRVIWEKTKMVGVASGAAPASSKVAAAVPADNAGIASPEDKTWTVGAPPLNEPEQYGDYAITAGVLERLNAAPDFSSDVPLRYAHRQDGPADIYFVANPENADIAAEASFRVRGKRPEIWDPVTSEMRELKIFTVKGRLTNVPLHFAPHQSFFIVFREPIGKAADSRPNFASSNEVQTLDGAWDVSFDPQWGGPERIVFDKLDDWSKRAEAGIKYYSGQATYRKSFDWKSPGDPGGKTRLFLDLGVVRNVARVRLNGQDLGVVWCAPWRVDITAAVKAGGNALEIQVANLWPNRLIGDEQEPPDAEYAKGGNLVRWPEWLLKGEPRPSRGRYTFATWKHFSKDSPLLPSGLLGPVTIRAEKD
jgi:hypothetical protein